MKPRIYAVSLTEALARELERLARKHNTTPSFLLRALFLTFLAQQEGEKTARALLKKGYKRSHTREDIKRVMEFFDSDLYKRLQNVLKQ